MGNNFSGDVIASYSTASVAGGADVGGLVGSNFSGRHHRQLLHWQRDP